MTTNTNTNRTELTTRFAPQKSFYKKAYIETADDGAIMLYSYDTLVAIWKDGDLTFITGNEYNLTRTTVRHLNEFISQMLGYSRSLGVANYRKLQALANDQKLSLNNV